MRLMKGLLSTIVMLPVVAFAQTAPSEPADPAPDTYTPGATEPPTPSGQLPPVQSDADPAPPVPTPNVPGLTGTVVEQAGNRSLTSAFRDAEALLISRLADVTLAELAADFRVHAARHRAAHSQKDS